MASLLPIQTQNERLIDLSDPTTMQEIESTVADQNWCSDINALAYIIIRQARQVSLKVWL